MRTADPIAMRRRSTARSPSSCLSVQGPTTPAPRHHPESGRPARPTSRSMTETPQRLEAACHRHGQTDPRPEVQLPRAAVRTPPTPACQSRWLPHRCCLPCRGKVPVRPNRKGNQSRSWPKPEVPQPASYPAPCSWNPPLRLPGASHWIGAGEVGTADLAAIPKDILPFE